MNFLLLSLLAIPSVMGDCSRFITTDTWERKFTDEDGASLPNSASFLRDAPIFQVSDIVTCNQEYVDAKSERMCGSSRDPQYCNIIGEGSVSFSARFSVAPTNNSVEALKAFFGVVSKAVDANPKVTPIDQPIPTGFNACGSLRTEFGKRGYGPPGVCVPFGSSGWLSFESGYLCVNGTAEDCMNGPFESGTQLLVCGPLFDEGRIDFNDNRTLTVAGQTYEAMDKNPSLNNGLTCEASMAVAGFEIKAWSFGIVGLSIIAGLLL